MKKLTVFTALIFSFASLFSQTPGSSSEILHRLKRLRNPTRVLYLAAHPDDENTRLISWLVNGAGCHTAYLSLTRGDGGQNLIGTELSEALGVLRTQELMQARTIDGGHQYFSRAVDFGYSKTADETFEKWNKKEVLSDVVWVLRQFRPDVIVTRFPPDSRAGHGHHTASAILAIEAFKLAGDETAFPDQLNEVETWSPKRIYWNASVWWNPALDSLARTDSNYISVNVGGYNPLIGRSYNELASLSRTQHKSQGFGVSVDRGNQFEYLKYLEGDRASGSLFDDIPASWERYGARSVDKALKKVIENFKPSDPSASVGALLELRRMSAAIADENQREYFVDHLDRLILDCMGLHAELLASRKNLVAGAEEKFTFEILSRSDLPVKVKSLKLGVEEHLLNKDLANNEKFSEEIAMTIPDKPSQPYWLMAPHENLYTVKKRQNIGKPENDPAISGTVELELAGTSLVFKLPLTYKYSDRVEGEITGPVFVVPDIQVTPLVSNLVFVKEVPQTLGVNFRLFNGKGGTVKVRAQGWTVEPSEIALEATGSETSTYVEFTITPVSGSRDTELKFILENNGEIQSMQEIDYDHIERRILLRSSAVKLIKIDLKKRGILVGYIPGAGDEVADAIIQMGYELDILDEAKLKNYDLSQYKAIIAGIRAYNTQDWLPELKEKLMGYVENGGNYIVQYNTASRDLLSRDIGPYPFELSRARVTEENAEPAFLLPDHPLLNKPNKITTADFDAWIQERGLYFAGTWDENYQAPIGWHDKGEDMQEGGLLIAHYGKGAFVYTGISFFRELPAGVPGAYRLLANIISYSNPVKDGQ